MTDRDEKNAFNVYRESWESYFRTLENHAVAWGSNEDRRAWLPDPREVRKRQELLAWLRACDFPSRLINSVMFHETPSIDYLKELLADGFNGEEIAKICEPLTRTVRV